MEIQLDPQKSTQENAAVYYEKSKKLKKKLKGIEEAIEETEKLIKKEELKETEEKIQEQKPVIKKEWFEIYHWVKFDDLLAIGGKSAKTNDIIFEKYFEKQDLFFHADVTGGSVFIAKDWKKYSKTQLKQVAQLSACYSRLWNAGRGTGDVMAADLSQVRKANKQGAFFLHGKREWFKKLQLKLCFNIKDGRIVYDFTGNAKVCIIPDTRKSKEDSAKIVLKQLKLFYKDKAKYLTLQEVMKVMPNGGSRIS